MENKDEIIIPAFWVSQQFGANPKLLSFISKKVFLPLFLVENYSIFILGLGLIGCLASFAIALKIHSFPIFDRELTIQNKDQENDTILHKNSTL